MQSVDSLLCFGVGAFQGGEGFAQGRELIAFGVGSLVCFRQRLNLAAEVFQLFQLRQGLVPLTLQSCELLPCFVGFVVGWGIGRGGLKFSGLRLQAFDGRLGFGEGGLLGAHSLRQGGAVGCRGVAFDSRRVAKCF